MTLQSAYLIAWSLGVLVSWVGWGRLAARWVVGTKRIDSGLCAVWGVAILVAIGGVLNALKLCSRPVVIGLSVAGIIMAMPAIWRGIRRSARLPGRGIRRLLPSVPLALGGLFMLLASIGYTDLSINYIDDFPFYMVMPIRMLEAGAADDPLCGRRLTTFGGYAFLQTQVLTSGYMHAPLVTDMGLSSIVVAMLLMGLPKRGVARWGTILIVLLAWLFPWARLNTMAATTITATVLGLGRTVLLADRSRRKRRLRVLAMAATVATTAATFRANLQVLPPLFFALYFLGRLWQARGPWRRTLTEAAVVLGVGLAVLLPWSYTLYRAAGSPLYPLLHGNHRDPQFSYARGAASVADKLSVISNTFATPLFILAALPLIVLIGQRRRTEICLYLAALLMTAATILTFPAADPPWIERFCLPTLLAAMLLGAHAVLRWTGVRAAYAAFAAAVLVLLMWPFDRTLTTLRMNANAARIGLAYDNASHELPDTVRAYAALQQAVPPGATIATALNMPIFLDYGRNPIYALDTPGYATKAGLWPFYKGPEATRQFLIAQGVEYLAFQNFSVSRPMYEPRWWQQAAAKGEPIGKLMLNMMQDFDALWQSSPQVFEGEQLRLIRLQ